MVGPDSSAVERSVASCGIQTCNVNAWSTSIDEVYPSNRLELPDAAISCFN